MNAALIKTELLVQENISTGKRKREVMRTPSPNPLLIEDDCSICLNTKKSSICNLLFYTKGVNCRVVLFFVKNVPMDCLNLTIQNVLYVEEALKQNNKKQFRIH